MSVHLPDPAGVHIRFRLPLQVVRVGFAGLDRGPALEVAVTDRNHVFPRLPLVLVVHQLQLPGDGVLFLVDPEERLRLLGVETEGRRRAVLLRIHDFDVVLANQLPDPGEEVLAAEHDPRMARQGYDDHFSALHREGEQFFDVALDVVQRLLDADPVGDRDFLLVQRQPPMQTHVHSNPGGWKKGVVPVDQQRGLILRRKLFLTAPPRYFVVRHVVRIHSSLRRTVLAHRRRHSAGDPPDARDSTTHRAEG